MTNILLFNPPGPGGKGFTREGRCTQEVGVWATTWPPVSLATAAAFLEKDNHNIRVIDFPAQNLDLDYLIKVLKKFKPDITIWNTGTPTLWFDLDLSKIIKNITNNAITCVIGTHVSVEADEVLKNYPVDIVIRGEPEITIRNICLNIDFKYISGISYKDKQNKISHNIDASYIKPEDICAPAWHYLDINAYKLPLKGRPFLIIAPIRGCPFKCSFCTSQLYYGKKLRKRPIANVISEIQNCITRYKVRDFFIWADTFTADKSYVFDFCKEIIRRNLNILWTCNSRVDTVDKDTLDIMKKAGLWMISFGLECGNNDVLKKTGKKITVEQSKYAVKIANELGIKTSGHFILGLPGETQKSMHETLSLSLSLPFDIGQFYSASPYPGTKLYKEAIECGWINDEKIYSQNQAVMNLPGLPAAEVNAFRLYAYKKFYFRIKTMFKMLSMFEAPAIIDLLKNIKVFFKWMVNK